MRKDHSNLNALRSNYIPYKKSLYLNVADSQRVFNGENICGDQTSLHRVYMSYITDGKVCIVIVDLVEHRYIFVRSSFCSNEATLMDKFSTSLNETLNLNYDCSMVDYLTEVCGDISSPSDSMWCFFGMLYFVSNDTPIVYREDCIEDFRLKCLYFIVKGKMYI